MSELQIEADTSEGVTVLALSGALDAEGKRALEQAMLAQTQAGQKNFVVDCAGLEQLSSEGMGVFLSHLIKLRKLKGDIKFCAMSDEVRNVLSVLGVGKLLVVKPTLREALDDFAESEEPAQKVKDSQKLRIEVHEEGSVTVFGLVGFVDRETIAQLDGQLSEALRTDRAQIVIDCAKLSYISSNGMGVFISYVNKARQQGGDIRLCNLKDVARTVITMLGLQRLFKVYETLDAAIASY